ncbi:flavodoxin domain-containing protein [Lacrimispora sp. BS-2]|uniref:Flavodoxin domain-containing protein n=1 Tax=Lacrimispora sp. BS-2 TaxID=3151850 RepID=A0AAU7PTF7_9FIRM
MKKIAVVYQSKYGATKKYAEWIAKELSCDLFEGKDIKASNLEPYDTIIFGGGLYAGGVNGIKLLTKNFSRLSQKNLVLFTCGLADPSDSVNTENIKKGLNKVLNEEMQEKIKVFHLRGGMNYSKLSPMHRTMMNLVYKMAAKRDQDSLTEEDEEMLASYGKSVDFTNKETILPLIKYIGDL